MPHFVIDCSKNVISLKSSNDIMQQVFKAAESTNLFEKDDIKVRINPFQYYQIGENKNGFIHVFANIMEGRTAIQKRNLSEIITATLKTMFPDLSIISINIRDFEKASYCNKSMI